MLCFPAAKDRLRDRFMIYGEQTRWELLPMLPVFAAQDGEGGLIGLARQGAAETECHVATDGQGGGAVGVGFSPRQLWPDPVEKSTREMRLRIDQQLDGAHVTAFRTARPVVICFHAGTHRVRQGSRGCAARVWSRSRSCRGRWDAACPG